MARTIEPEQETTPRVPLTRREVVLVVDDDEQVLRLVKRVLERAGFECLAVGDGHAAHNAAVESRPDIILLEPHARRHDGRPILTEIRNDFLTG